jgi:predicted ATPase
MNGRKIDKLTIRGFQSIKSLEDFELRDINILIGANGTGKSNFINYFRMLRELVERRLRLWVGIRGGANRLLTHGVKNTQGIYSQVVVGDYGYTFALTPTLEDELKFAVEEIYHLTEDGVVMGETDKIYTDEVDAPAEGYRQTFGSGHSESKLQEFTTYYVGRNVLESISNWQVFHVHDTGDRALMKRPSAVHDAGYLRSDASNLASFLYKLKRSYNHVYDEIVTVVKLAIPFFDTFIFEPETLISGEQQVVLLWRQKESDYVFHPSQLSDGSIRFICLATALLQPNPPATIIIDEPELGLHPYALSILAALIRSAATEVQVIVSTQSVALVDEFAPEDVIVVEREQGVSSFRRLTMTELEGWLEEYTLGELWVKNIFGGIPTR